MLTLQPAGNPCGSWRFQLSTPLFPEVSVRILALSLLTALSLAGCGSRYPPGGLCVADSDCRLCTPCGCATAYAVSDVDTASCDQIAAQTSCAPAPEACRAGALEALCASGHCQLVGR